MELLVILLFALVIFGPKKLPELGKSLGQGIREFKKATQAITEEVSKVAAEEPAPKRAADPTQETKPVENTEQKG